MRWLYSVVYLLYCLKLNHYIVKMQIIEPAMLYRLKFKSTTCQVHLIRSYTLLAYGARTKYWSLLFLVAVLELPKIKNCTFQLKNHLRNTYACFAYSNTIPTLIIYLRCLFSSH